MELASLSTYLVETYWPGVTEAAVRETIQRARLSAKESTRRHREISYVTSYLVGKDEAVFSLFRARSVSTIERVCLHAGLAVDRIVGIVRIDDE